MVSQSSYRDLPQTRDWQTRGWQYYDDTPELRFTVTWLANALSRARLYVGVPDPDGSGDPDPVVANEGDEPRPGVDPRAQAPLDKMFGGQTGMSQALVRMAQHLTVVGETYLAGYETGGSGQQWKVLSNFELEQSGSRIKILNNALMGMPAEESNVYIEQGRGSLMRIWRPHPRLHWEADSAVRALLSTLEELRAISAHVHASLESRLAGAGMLVLPESATLPTADVSEDSPLYRDPETAALIEAMVTAISNRDSASAIVPIICRIADEAAAKVQHLRFSTPLDDKVLDLRQSAINRFAAGMDLPQEIALGLASAIHQKTSRQVEEMSIKVHVEPLLAMICDALTTRYLQPVLTSMKTDEPQKYVVWYDISELTQPPDRSPAARELYQMGLLSPDAVLRESGFGDHEIPGEQFARAHLISQMALRGIPPEVTNYYLQLLGLNNSSDRVETRMVREGTDVPGRPRSGGNAGGNAGGRRPATQPSDVPGTANAPLPGPSLSAGAAMQGWSLQAVELAVLRALEIAGKRMLSKAGRTVRGEVTCEPWRIHTQLPTTLDVSDPAMDKLLDGAYTALDRVMPERPTVRVAIDTYVRQLIASQRDHSPGELIAALGRVGCLDHVTQASTNGYSNGYTNGYANGYSNGHANGHNLTLPNGPSNGASCPSPNGQTTGHRNGHENTAPNGVNGLKKGLANGFPTGNASKPARLGEGVNTGVAL
jgi:hypothetical protein